MAKLQVVTNVIVIMALIGFVFREWTQAIEASTPGRKGEIDSRIHTDANAAFITLTNLNKFKLDSICMQGKIVSKTNANRIALSVPVCTGEIPARATVTMVAPYTVGEPIEVCGKKEYSIDWTGCSFTTELK